MPLLYYWRGDNYRRDLDMGVGYHLNQANPLMHQINIGESVWAFTRRPDGIYVLAAELIVKAKTKNPPKFRYGRYRIWGDIHSSRYFQVDQQPGIENVIRSLSVKSNAQILGQSFQGYAAVKQISQSDHDVLNSLVKYLPIENRAKILPEDNLEASLIMGDVQGVMELVKNEKPGIAEQRIKYLYSQAPARNKKLVENLHEMYSGKCQICLWDPVNKYGNSLCEGHHIQWLSRGGSDELSNMVLVCPNHHSAIHRTDAPLDYDDLGFDFTTHKEYLNLTDHLRV
jgi:5-methylcytosine-specific restriction protein A